MTNVCIIKNMLKNHNHHRHQTISEALTKHRASLTDHSAAAGGRVLRGAHTNLFHTSTRIVRAMTLRRAATNSEIFD